MHKWLCLTFLVLSCKNTPENYSDRQDVIIARISGLPVYKSDFIQSIKSGRFGGSPELILDELLNLTLVLKECEMLGAKEICSSGSVLERAENFLRVLYPVSRVCGEIENEIYVQTYEAMRGREIDLDSRLDDLFVRIVIESRICESRAKKIRRAYVNALRQNARIEKYQHLIDEAVSDAQR